METTQREKNLGTLEAAKVVYEEVKGQKYREEQVAVKLLEYLEMKNELSMRGGELERIGLGSLVGKEALNDDKFLLAA